MNYKELLENSYIQYEDIMSSKIYTYEKINNLINDMNKNKEYITKNKERLLKLENYYYEDEDESKIP